MATATAPSPASIGLTRPKTSLSSSLWIPAYSLWRRELVRFYRQKARVVGVIASPLLFWLVLGSGFSKTFQSHGAASAAASGSTHYLSYFFPGAIIMIVLFTAIFSMMSLIQDRNEGFLLSVLASPVSRSAIVLGKVLGGATLAAIQGWVFLVFCPLAGVHTTLARHSVCDVGDCAHLVLAHRARLRHRLADGFHPGLSCHHQPRPDSALAGIGCAVSRQRSLWLVAILNASESAHLRCRHAAQWPVPCRGHNLFARVQLDHHRGLLRGGIRWLLGGRQPSQQ